MRWVKAVPVWTAGVALLALCGCAGPPATGGSPAAAGSAARTPTAIPATDPVIQRWFLANGTAKVAFNDALLRAERGVAAGTTAQCRPLDVAAGVLISVLPKLAAASPGGQQLAAAIEPPLVTFRSATAACLARDFSAAQAALDAGVAQQAAAQAAVDEILDGER